MLKTFLFLLGAASLLADQLKYQKPSKEILDVLNAPAPSVLAVNRTRTHATLSQMVRYPSIAPVSESMLRVAGMRIDPRTHGLHLAPQCGEKGLQCDWSSYPMKRTGTAGRKRLNMFCGEVVVVRHVCQERTGNGHFRFLWKQLTARRR